MTTQDDQHERLRRLGGLNVQHPALLLAGVITGPIAEAMWARIAVGAHREQQALRADRVRASRLAAETQRQRYGRTHGRRRRAA